VLNAAYNYPAHTKVACPWDVYADVAFVYWQPIQENMEVGVINHTGAVSIAGIGDTTPFVAFPQGFRGRRVEMGFDYKPGFEVTLGTYFNRDNWDVMGRYTWFHNTQSKSTSVVGTDQLFATYGHPLFLGQNAYQSVSASWKLDMDIADLTVGRWYYVGKNLTVRPSVGARGAFIHQRNTVTYVGNGSVTGSTADTATNHLTTKSWAVGPEIALDLNWNFCRGFRFYGCTEADLIYTRYPTSRAKYSHTATSTFKVVSDPVNAVRTHLDLELGFGWGMHLFCHKYYLDLAAGYEFQAFFDQNMFQYYSDDIMIVANESPRGNLYLQGLTARLKFDF
jgi:hypothetical protein